MALLAKALKLKSGLRPLSTQLGKLLDTHSAKPPTASASSSALAPPLLTARSVEAPIKPPPVLTPPMAAARPASSPTALVPYEAPPTALQHYLPSSRFLAQFDALKPHHMTGMRPGTITETQIDAGSVQYQYPHPGGGLGNWSTPDKSATPWQLGISPVGIRHTQDDPTAPPVNLPGGGVMQPGGHLFTLAKKRQVALATAAAMPAIQSESQPIRDEWSNKWRGIIDGQPTQVTLGDGVNTSGGARQHYTNTGSFTVIS